MARITMRNSQKATFVQVFEVYISAVTARGVKDKTIATYKQHFHAISKRLDGSLLINRLSSTGLDNMILQMRKEGLSDSSINSYTRTLKCFLSWCNEEGYTKTNLKIYKAAETVKEVYTDDELLTLLKKPEADCKFCEYRNWVIVNFLLNSGCRAATVRNIQNQDVDLSRRQIVLRHTKNGKIQVIPLCTAMVSILRDYMTVREGEAADYLFCNEFGGFLTENALRLAIVKYNNSRGVERTSIHAFRHTFARKYLVDCGGDAFSIQQIMGHSTLKISDADIENKRLLDEAWSRKFYWYAVVCLAAATLCSVIYYFTQVPYLYIVSMTGAIGYIVLGILSKPKYKRFEAKKMIVPYGVSRLVILSVIIAVIVYAFTQA